MREETRLQLDRLQGQGVSSLLWLCVLLALLGAGFCAFRMSASDERQIAGTVQSADWRLNNDTGQQYPFIEVKLDSGSSVRVGSDVSALPTVGDRITLRQRAMLFDYMTVYQWDGPVSAAAEPPEPTQISHP